MNKQKHSSFLAAAMLILSAAAAAVFGFQPAGSFPEKTLPLSAFQTAYQTLIQEQLVLALHGAQGAKPLYQIADPNAPAPRPDPEKYGQSQTPEDLTHILTQAAPLLDGQSLFFSPEVTLFPDSSVRWYLDDTILVITWKQRVENTAFTFAEVKLRHPSQLRRYLSGGEFGSGQLALTTEMSESVNAVLGCSGDYYAYRRRGLTIVDGIAKKYVPGLPDVCFVNKDGDLILERDQNFADLQAVQDYADENNIRFSLSFGPILVRDGENICPRSYDLGEVKDRYSRAALCQMDSLHYLYIAAGTEGDAMGLMTMNTFSEHVAATGCRQAYALDGGQTTTIVLDGQVINRVNYGSQRRISDILYFSTAVPGGA